METPKEAEIYLEMLEDINYKIDEFIDLYLHGEIRRKVEKEEKKEILKEERNHAYITTELVLDRAMEELDRAKESIKMIFASKLF